VGAYGQEAKNVIESVTVFNKDSHEIQNLKASDCGFGYRSSIFNLSRRGKYIIFYINLKLSKIPRPTLSYRDVQIKFSGKNPSLAEIRNEVIKIRDQKFPFPTEAKKGNAGSFFKNPVLNENQYKDLSVRVKNLFGDDKVAELESKKFNEQSAFAKALADDPLLNKIKWVKVPAAFLIELCGLKDLKSGGAAINHNQPLVIINQTGHATAQDVLKLANEVKRAVLDKTGIALQFEPELIGFG
ncbi:MAG: hypothetical protein ACHQVK_03070, partial [Candidatus Paceibacterales bacterium]